MAARLQTHPTNVKNLVGDADSLAAESARRGVAYRFDRRPQQWRRPRPLHLALDQELAASAEIARLFNDVPGDRKSPVPRRGQMFTFVGSDVRTRSAPSGPVASGANHPSLPIGFGSGEVQPGADEMYRSGGPRAGRCETSRAGFSPSRRATEGTACARITGN